MIGTGLTARDQQAAAGRALDFVPAPLPRGLVALWSPARVQAGRQFHVGGRAEGLRGGSAELLDPGQHVVARSAIDANDHFELAGIARSAGPATWQLRLRDTDKARIEDATLPLVVEPGAALRVLMLAGAPNPELKYLRRWATDAGLSLDTRISLGAGMQIGDAPAAFDAASLGKLDLVVLDQRAWQALGDARRAALDAAVRNGLGLLLQLPAALSGNDRAALRRLGFTASAGGAASEVRLPTTATVLDDNAGTQRESLPTLSRGPVRITAIDGSPLLPDAGGTPLASWRAQGAGRIGVATFGDSFRLVLAGHPDQHGELWGTLFSTLARATRRAWPGNRTRCTRGPASRCCAAWAMHAAVDEPDGHAVALAIDPASGTSACAGFWPRLPGWHLLREPAPAQAGGERGTAFHVRASGDAPGLQAAALREATQGLVAAGHPVRQRIAATPGRRWPWFLGWLLLSAALWWFERSRIGAARSTATAPASGA